LGFVGRLVWGCWLGWLGWDVWPGRCGLGARSGAGLWCEEASAVGWGVGIEVIAHGVDDDVVVEPADRSEVLSVGDTALGVGGDVVGFDPVAGRAPVDDTSLVSPQDVAFQSGWDRCCCSADPEWLSVLCHCGDLNAGVA
jgi:hypothetical protein